MTKKINFKLIDNFIEHALTKIIIIKIRLRNYVKKNLCLITSLNKFDLIFDMFWMKKHNVNIEKNNCSLLFKSKHCLHYYILNQQSLKVFNKTLSKNCFKLKLLKKLFSYRKKINVNYNVVSIEIFIIITTKNDYKIIVLWFQHFEQLKKSKEIDKYITYNNLTTKLSTISTNNYEKFFVKHSKIFLIIEKLKKKNTRRFL